MLLLCLSPVLLVFVEVVVLVVVVATVAVDCNLL